MAGGTVNKVILIGNLGKDPEIRSTQDGREIANITIATSESWTDKNSGERREKTEWHKVAIFNPGLVGLCKKYLHKGSKVFIEGQLQTRKWQDATSGQDRYVTEVVIQGYNGALTFLDSNKSGGSGGGNYDNSGSGSSYSSNAKNNSSNNDNASSADYINELDDEIPF